MEVKRKNKLFSKIGFIGEPNKHRSDRWKSINVRDCRYILPIELVLSNLLGFHFIHESFVYVVKNFLIIKKTFNEII